MKSNLNKKGQNPHQPAPHSQEATLGERIESILASDIHSMRNGYLDGSMSGESWKAFLQAMQEEVVARLAAYRAEAAHSHEFRASSLEMYCEQRMKIEREYLGALVDLYVSAERAYKTLSG